MYEYSPTSRTSRTSRTSASPSGIGGGTGSNAGSDAGSNPGAGTRQSEWDRIPPPPPSPSQLQEEDGGGPGEAEELGGIDGAIAAARGIGGGMGGGGGASDPPTTKDDPQQPTATGLIRLTLRKPMGIVFEPMTDPHNTLQQRGVRICDLPRTGAAALSGKLQIGDELLSINEKTMSRLTFDEIMDFIIEAEPDRVALLFRRPRKDGLGGVGGGVGVGVGVGAAAAAGGGAMASTANAASDTKVKWIDDQSNAGKGGGKSGSGKGKGKHHSHHDAHPGGGRGDEPPPQQPPPTTSSSSKRSDKDATSSSRRSRAASSGHHDDDNTSYVSGGTFETRETLETFETRETREQNRKKSKRHKSRRGGGGGGSGGSRYKDAEGEMYGESFLDMLIDSLCAPLVAGDKKGSKGRRGGDGDDYYSDDEDDYTYEDEDRTFDSRAMSEYDDDTFVTYGSGSVVTEVTRDSNTLGSLSRRRPKARILSNKDGSGGGGGGQQQQQNSKKKGRVGDNEEDDAVGGEGGVGGGGGRHGKKKGRVGDNEEDDAVGGEGGVGGQQQQNSKKKGRVGDNEEDDAVGGEGGVGGGGGRHGKKSGAEHDRRGGGGNNVSSSAAGAPGATPRNKDAAGLLGPYEDDATLETVDTAERAANVAAAAAAAAAVGGGVGPLGLAPIDEYAKSQQTPGADHRMFPSSTTDDKLGLGGGAGAVGMGMGMGMGMGIASEFPDPNLPISELEYDDHGADVSVMESLGGPSLLIENQQQRSSGAGAGGAPHGGTAEGGAASPKTQTVKIVSPELVKAYGNDYEGGEAMIAADPDKFYRRVVLKLLEANEPEKVRLLDKLLAKYEGREEHLIAKLSVRYEKAAGGGTDAGGASSDVNAQSKSAAGAEQGGGGFETFGSTFPSVPSGTPADPDGANEASGRPGWDEPNKKSEDRNLAAEGKGHHHDQHDGVSDVSDSKRSDMTGSDDGSYSSASAYSGTSIDGTSPAVIAQVSELLNYVYGKTSVPGQIDRVSTIMRAYEGREAVLLELLETKALIKANSESGDGALSDLPASLKNSPALAINQGADGPDGAAAAAPSAGKSPPPNDSPMSGLTTNSQKYTEGGNVETQNFTGADSVNSHSSADTDDGAVESPTAAAEPVITKTDSSSPPPFSATVKSGTPEKTSYVANPAKESGNPAQQTPGSDAKKKKKKKGSLFGKVFGSKKSKKSSVDAPSGTPKKGSKLLSPKGRPGKSGVPLSKADSYEGSI
eukprot:CAMPEP_0178711746 /NCGR_PEP_ID=MMETSP0699-20121125/18508_1 /TAXON_ID=265572 /ORGANISM="Extubocellulus spinifer, Strain CCMP396" /LENGTH=1240 /DNA_ID=CAMNT_0020360441 /DNA_START=562 /DNA_END=4284 /DNA_ORIENTATION=-